MFSEARRVVRQKRSLLIRSGTPCNQMKKCTPQRPSPLSRPLSRLKKSDVIAYRDATLLPHVQASYPLSPPRTSFPRKVAFPRANLNRPKQTIFVRTTSSCRPVRLPQGYYTGTKLVPHQGTVL